MKKLLITSSIIGSLASSVANAKTEGNYVGLSIIKSDIEAKGNTISGVNFGNNPFLAQDESQVSVGVNYKYAYNFDGIYIAPGAFFDYTNVSTNGQVTNGATTTFDVDYRYGLRVDLGYDVTNELATYVHLGAANNSYGNTWSFNGNSSSTSDSETATTYGVGAKYSLTSNLDVNLEYEVSEFDMDMNFVSGIEGKQEFEIKVLRAGVAFKF